ncbi:hypothetical protein NM208_g6719 [Fusarium decemcellulare]|uniref:Uncharacterized protein n=1 Tax=Fusarium decemcellulare TaxID=57161 RepID=A0ACC1SBV5_9HYPO|nr:hypothetical protein NM208_g6719 [Fusarium decemcellulare]
MDTQSSPTTLVGIWGYCVRTSVFAAPYPYLAFFPTLAVARHSKLAAPLGSETKPTTSPKITNFFTAFNAPFRGFCIWLVDSLIRCQLKELLDQYLPDYFASCIVIILCAPLNLLWTWSILPETRSRPVKDLVKTLRSIEPKCWLRHIATLLACESLNSLAVALTGRIFGEVKNRTDDMIDDLDSAQTIWIEELLTTLPCWIASALTWAPTQLVSVRSAISIPQLGLQSVYGGGKGFWEGICTSLKSMDRWIFGKLIRNFFMSTVAVTGAAGLAMAITIASDTWVL